MIFYPMRDNILRIEVDQRKDSMRLKCADAASWMWDSKSWPEDRTYKMYSATGIIKARNTFNQAGAILMTFTVTKARNTFTVTSGEMIIGSFKTEQEAQAEADRMTAEYERVLSFL
jgi:hypothetical protein